MKRRSFLQALAGIAAAIPTLGRTREPTFEDWTIGPDEDGEMLYGFAPAAEPEPAIDPTRRYYLGVDVALKDDWTAFAVWRTDPDGVMRMVESRAFPRHQVVGDELLEHAWDVGQYEGLMSLSAEEAERWQRHLRERGQVVRYVHQVPLL